MSDSKHRLSLMSTAESDEHIQAPVKLSVRAIFGINGKVNFGLRLHPNGKHILFPLGTKIGIDDTVTNKEEFIAGHTHNVSCLDVSRSGRFMASGQINHMGFPGFVILWDFHARRELIRHDLHKVLVQSLCFTAEDKYLISIGGLDDGTVIVFDIETRTPICRSVASRGISGYPDLVRGLNNSSSFFITAGDRHLRMWSIQREMKKLSVVDIYVGKHQRRFCCIDLHAGDEFAYLGTYTGDIVKVALNCCDLVNVNRPNETSSFVGAFGTHNKRKPYGKDCDRYVNGVRVIFLVDDGKLLVGSGDGTVELVEERKDASLISFKSYPNPTWPFFRVLKKTKVNGAVSSFVRYNEQDFYMATDLNEIYLLNIKTFTMKLLKTSHRKAVNAIVFPKNISSVFATAGFETIRVWSTKRLQELLRIMVYNFVCSDIVFSNDGTCIISAWNDGIIRAFTPITGRLIYAIPNAHNKGCSAVAISSTGQLLVSGGTEGQVRMWKIEPFRQSLLSILKDHSGPITSLDFNKFDTEVISASTDGSCVIWDVQRLSRKIVIAANTQFMTAKYFPTGVQCVSCGTDGRISYWMVYNGRLIRELQGSQKSSVNDIDINGTGDFFVSAGSDQMVKLWDYNRGIVVAEGCEHASAVLSISFSPCRKFFVSGCKDGSIIIWDVPPEFWGKENPTPICGNDKYSNDDLLKPASSKIELVKASSSHKNLNKTENIDALLANTPKNNVCCVECPPVLASKKTANKNAPCHYMPDIKKC